MAEFDLKIAAMRMDVEYTTIPSVSAPEVLEAIFVERTNEVSTTSGQYVYDWLITGTQFDPNTKYVVFAQAAFGGSTSSTLCEIQVVTGSGTTTTDIWSHAMAEGYDSPAESPGAQQASHLSALFEITNAAQEDMGFRFLSTTQQPIYIKGMSILAIPMSATGITENEDWFLSQVTGNTDLDAEAYSSSSGFTEHEVYSAQFDITTAGEYAIFYNTEWKTSNPNGVEECWLNYNVNGSPVDLNWYRKQNEDARDRRHYMPMVVQTLNVGLNDFSIKARWEQGNGTRRFYRPSICALRLSHFAGYNYQQTPTPESWEGPVNVYPFGETTRWFNFDAGSTDTNVFLFGQALMRRSGNGGKIARLDVDGTLYGDFVCDANTVGTDPTQDQALVPVFGMYPSNTTRTVSLDLANGNRSPGDTFHMNSRLLAINLLVQSSVTYYEKTIVDGETTEENVTPASARVSDTEATSEQVTWSAGGSGLNRPGTAHPRLWLNKPGFLNYLQTAWNTSSAFWQVFEGKINLWNGGGSYSQSGYDRAFYYAIHFAVTGNTSSRDSSLSQLLTMLRSEPTSSANGPFYNDGRMCQFAVRNVCIAFTLLKAYAPSLITQAIENEVHNWLMMVTNCIYDYRLNPISEDLATPPGSTKSEDLAWASNNPYQNYYEAKMQATTYAAIILEGSQYFSGGWWWPFADGSETGGVKIAWSVPFSDTGSGPVGGFYTDPWEFVVERMEQMTIPALEDRVRGGDWLEGYHYGRVAVANLIEQCIMMRDASGLDYARSPAHPFFEDFSLGKIYAIQPNESRLFYLGEATASALHGQVTSEDRRYMLMAAAALEGTAGGAYAQYWLDNGPITQMNGSSYLDSWDLFFHRDFRVATDYKSVHPPQYYASGTGFTNSRTDWSDSAVSFNVMAQNHRQGHQHHDSGGIQLYHGIESGGTGWVLGDFQLSPSGSSTYDQWTSVVHNCAVWEETYNSPGELLPQRFTAPGLADTGTMVRNESTTYHTYCQADMSDAYWVDLSSSRAPGAMGQSGQSQVDEDDDETILESYQREMVFLHALNGYLVVYDRVQMRTTPQESGASGYYTDYSLFPMHQHWHTQGVPIVPVGDYLRSDRGTSSRMYMRFFGHDAVGITDMGASWFRIAPRTVGGPANRDMMAIIEPTTTAKSNPTTVNEITGTDMWGVEILDLTEHNVVIFSTIRGGTAPGLLIYSCTKGAANRHMICNLTPNASYDAAIVENASTIDVIVGAGTQLAASSEGVVTFDPLDIPALSDHNYSVDDTETTSDTVDPPDYSFTITDSSATSEAALGGPNAAEIYLESTSESTDEDVVWVPGFNPRDTEATMDPVSYTVSEPGFIVEKTIPEQVAFIVPELAIGAGWVPSPNDGVLYNKINSTLVTPDDDTFIFTSTQGNAFIVNPFSSPALTVTPQSIKLRIRTREVATGGNGAINLNYSLYDDLSVLKGSGTIIVYGNPGAMNHETGAIPWAGSSADGIGLILTATAANWNTNVRVEISEIDLAVVHAGAEKIIP